MDRTRLHNLWFRQLLTGPRLAADPALVAPKPIARRANISSGLTAMARIFHASVRPLKNATPGSCQGGALGDRLKPQSLAGNPIRARRFHSCRRAIAGGGDQQHQGLAIQRRVGDRPLQSFEVARRIRYTTPLT